MDSEALPLALHGEPLHARTVRLTHAQWERSVRYLLQLDGDTGHQSGLTQDAAGVNEFSNNEESLIITGTLWNDFNQAAEELAADVAQDSARLSAIYPGTDSAGFIETFGRRAFRRPLSTEERQQFQTLYDLGASFELGGASEFARGARAVIQAALQSPHFLYRVELADVGAPLGGYEIAAKLSLVLRNVTPDDGLLDAAAAGELDTEAGVRTHATRMLEEQSLVEVMRAYHGELFRFNRFLTITKDTSTVPEYTPQLNEELQEASYRFFDRIVRDSLGLREILTADFGYAGPAMASLYQASAPAPGAYTEVALPDARLGFFTQLPFLILNSDNERPDPIHRGVAMNHDVLCAEVPPPNVANPVLPAGAVGQTNRDRVTAGTGTGTCGGACHGTYINPLGFAFESFDGMGRERTTDSGQPVNTSDSYPFAEGRQTFTGASDLMHLMADGQQAHACYAKHLAEFVLQRDLSEADRALVDALTASSRSEVGSVKQLLLALVTDPAFTTRSEEATP